MYIYFFWKLFQQIFVSTCYKEICIAGIRNEIRNVYMFHIQHIYKFIFIHNVIKRKNISFLFPFYIKKKCFFFIFQEKICCIFVCRSKCHQHIFFLWVKCLKGVPDLVKLKRRKKFCLLCRIFCCLTDFDLIYCVSVYIIGRRLLLYLMFIYDYYDIMRKNLIQKII